MWKPKFTALAASLGVFLPLLAGVPALADTRSTTTTISVTPNPVPQGDSVTVMATVTVAPNGVHSVEGDTVNFLTKPGACNGGGFGAVGSDTISSGDATLGAAIDTSVPGEICIRAVYPEVIKNPSHTNQTSQDEVTLVIEPGTADLEIVKQNVMGPYDLDGDLDGTGTTFDAVTVNQTGPDDGGIWIGLDEPQRFKFEIKITNNGSMLTAMGAVITDVVPAEFNLDPILQEDHENGTIDGVCNDGDADFLCDGTSGGTTLIGAVSDDEAKCTVTADQPPGADKDVDPPLDQRFKEPELLTIDIVAMDNGDMCTVTVYVITDGNPGHVMKFADVEQCTDAPLNSTGQLSAGTDCMVPSSDEVLLFTLYGPTSCAQVGVIKGTSDPIFDTISLNDGVKLFDPQSGERILGPQGSLQLTCNFPA